MCVCECDCVCVQVLLIQGKCKASSRSTGQTVCDVSEALKTGERFEHAMNEIEDLTALSVLYYYYSV